MNDKRKARRAAYEARQEKEGKNVVMWIGVVLIVLALCFVAYSAVMIS